MISKKDNRIGNPVMIVIATMLWAVGMLYVSGIGQVYKVYDRTMLIVLTVLGYYILKGRFRVIKKQITYILVFVILQNLYFWAAYGRTYVSYLCLYFMVALFSKVKITDRQIRIIGLIYGILGGVLLVVINYTSILSGWNSNTLAMQAFFSYVVFASAISKVRKWWTLLVILLYSIVYFQMLDMLNSRSAVLLSIVALLCVFKVIPIKRMLTKKTTLLIALLPLIIAVFVVCIRNTSMVISLNQWSLSQFHKPLFNGRDELWKAGVDTWQNHILIGSSNLATPWHNSAVSCLVGLGALGYIVWIYIINYCWTSALKWIDDDGILGLLTAFMVIWIQQSVELGMISTNANPLIFTILGLLMARINTLRKY